MTPIINLGTQHLYIYIYIYTNAHTPAHTYAPHTNVHTHKAHVEKKNIDYLQPVISYQYLFIEGRDPSSFIFISPRIQIGNVFQQAEANEGFLLASVHLDHRAMQSILAFC